VSDHAPDCVCHICDPREDWLGDASMSQRGAGVGSSTEANMNPYIILSLVLGGIVIAVSAWMKRKGY